MVYLKYLEWLENKPITKVPTENIFQTLNEWLE